MFLKFKLWIYRKWLEFDLRNEDEDVCCCGDYISKCNPWYCGATPRSMKEYVITRALANYKEKKNGKKFCNPI